MNGQVAENEDSSKRKEQRAKGDALLNNRITTAANSTPGVAWRRRRRR